jgi:hypothetical protein
VLREDGANMGATLQSKRRRKLLVAGSFVALAAIGTLAVLMRNKEEAPVPSGPTAHGMPMSELAKAQALDAEQMKAAILNFHPGMAVEEVFQEPPVDPMRLSIEERKARIEKGIEELAREGRDDEWAPRQESRLVEEFSRLRDGFIHPTKVECRSSLCVVAVTWDDAQSGQAAYDNIISSPLGTGCRLEMVPPAEDATQAQILMDCTEVRSRPPTVSMVATREALRAERREHSQSVPGEGP